MADPRIAQLDNAIDAGQIVFGAWGSGQKGKSLLGTVVPAFSTSRLLDDIPPGTMPQWVAHLLMIVDGAPSSSSQWVSLVKRAIACIGSFNVMNRKHLATILSAVATDALPLATPGDATVLQAVIALLNAEGGAPPPKNSDYLALASRAGGAKGIAVSSRLCEAMAAGPPALAAAKAASAINAAIAMTAAPDVAIGRIVTVFEAAAAGG